MDELGGAMTRHSEIPKATNKEKRRMLTAKKVKKEKVTLAGLELGASERWVLARTNHGPLRKAEATARCSSARGQL